MELEVRNHPELEHVLVREDGYIFVPSNGARKEHWTFGSNTSEGYKSVKIRGKTYRVHLLVARAFIGPKPDGMVCDHIDRNKANNSWRNLRYTSLSGNRMNCEQVECAFDKYGFHPKDDRSRYQRERLMLDCNAKRSHQESSVSYRLKHREELASKSREYNASMRAKGLVHRKCADGKYRWISRAEVV